MIYQESFSSESHTTTYGDINETSCPEGIRNQVPCSNLMPHLPTHLKPHSNMLD